MHSEIPISVLIVEDHKLIRVGIISALARFRDISIIGEAENGEEAIEKVVNLRPDVVIMDISMPVMNGLESSRHIRNLDLSTKIIMLTTFDRDDVVQSAFSSGANGYCLKDIEPNLLYEAICTVHGGGIWLDSAMAEKVLRLSAVADEGSSSVTEDGAVSFSQSERLYLRRLLEGATPRLIAEELNLSTSVATTKVVNILKKVERLKLPSDEEQTEFSEPNRLMTWPESLTSKYQCLGILGRGGMSTVFKVKHKLLNEIQAVKFLAWNLSTDRIFASRFTREARIISHLSHPNIISIRDHGVIPEGLPYLVMEYADGPSLADMLQRSGPIEEGEARSIFLQLTRGLGHAHENGVVHRDVKPGNVILTLAQSRCVPKIVDFGLAKISQRKTVSQDLTQSGQILGSPLYMSPEQCRGDNIDRRSDIYSLGCLMYETIAGRPPLKRASAVETMSAHLTEIPNSIEESLCSKGLNEIILRCLEKDPDDRYGDFAELCDSLMSLN